MTVSIQGDTITMRGGRLEVPTQPVIPFIEGDGTGRDIWRSSVRVFDAAVAKCYPGRVPGDATTAQYGPETK
jgi:isocitrate dehydrogenase